MAGVFDYSKEQRTPTVHEFLDTYRYLYEQTVKPYDRELTDQAYQRLFDVENRTDDLIEAQIIIEKEHLILDTVTADYKQLAEDFMDAADPNYDVTSASVKATIGVYATATSIDEITYIGEVAKATCDDLAVQVKLKVEMVTIFNSLIITWERLKRKIRSGKENPAAMVKAMVLTRRQMRQYYRFLSEDMGITFEMMEKTPFYRISMLDPKGLDELWRIKKVMHPDNIKAIKYVLFEEILSEKSMEEILLTPQPYPFYDHIDTIEYPDLDGSYMEIAENLNKDKKFFQQNRGDGSDKKNNVTAENLISRTNKLSRDIAASVGNPGGMSFGMQGGAGTGGGIKNAFSGMYQAGSGFGKQIAGGVGKSVAIEAAKGIGKGLLRGLFKK